MKKIKIAGLVFLIFFLQPVLIFAQEAKTTFIYQVVSVQDGDTFTATDGNVEFRVRMAGMDAPEHAQPYGKMAKYRLKSLIESQPVTITPIKKARDRYGRVLGNVFANGQDISLLMIQEGLATYYRPTCHDYPEDKNKYDYDPDIYIQAETVAKAAGKNIWSRAHVELPCAFRRK
ncbi:MAG: thermonuclease family protein [Deltaproteobacteria bacterium]|nr:thermonuclease family protein [Deltaproteobacteria bacterium]